MTDSGPNQLPSRAPTELMELAKWIDDQLGATAISRQVIAEQAADRWLHDARAEGAIVSEAVQRRVLDEALGAYGESLQESLDAREAGDHDGPAGA